MVVYNLKTKQIQVWLINHNYNFFNNFFNSSTTRLKNSLKRKQ